MAIRLCDSLPIVVDRANSLLRTGMFEAAQQHYLLAAELVHEAGPQWRQFEDLQIFAAWFCAERQAGRLPKDLPDDGAVERDGQERAPGYGHEV